MRNRSICVSAFASHFQYRISTRYEEWAELEMRFLEHHKVRQKKRGFKELNVFKNRN